MLAALQSNQGLISHSAALAAVALIGYLFGRRTRQQRSELPPELARELRRAQRIAVELQDLAGRIRRELAMHQGNVTRFQADLQSVAAAAPQDVWRELGARTENLLNPTVELSANLCNAYDQLRRHTNELLTFTGSRTDPATGVYTRGAMEQQLNVLASQSQTSAGRFSLALFSLAPQSHAAAEPVDQSNLGEFAALIRSSARDDDYVARYGVDEFAVIMPQTTLAGAIAFSSRLVQQAKEQRGCLVWAGVVEKTADDSPHGLLSRADSALYSARTQPAPCLYQHTGQTIRGCGETHAPNDATVLDGRTAAAPWGFESPAVADTEPPLWEYSAPLSAE